jgi:hypothetical protein
MTNFSETFRWHYYIFDITKINADISCGALNGTPVVLPRATIEWYSNSILGVTDPESRRFPQLTPINTGYAKGLMAPRVDEAIVLAQLDSFSSTPNDLIAGLEVEGVLGYAAATGQIVEPDTSSAPEILVIDGNHRIAAAYFQGGKSVSGLLLKSTQWLKYLQYQH